MRGISKSQQWLRRAWTSARGKLSGSEAPGASLVEYMLLVVLIAIVALIALQFAGAQNSELWSEVGSALN